MSAIPTIIAVLPESTHNVPRYLMACRNIVTRMTGNPSFPAPTPPLPEVSAALDALATREELAQGRGKGMVQERDVALRGAHSHMTMLKAYVQVTANAEPEKAEAIVLSSGMDVAKPRTWTKPPIEAKHGDAPGRVVLDTKALPKPVQYRWQMSTDQGTWTDLTETFKTKTTVEGLVPARVYSFRLRTVTNNGPSEWSPPVTIVTH
ncbi:MAG TPA: fibronectin type III domain-containing protein [Polyangiaceae bacterium]|nr:fibronectin type III domain-containing protein [Polyangiaceae bacterium]